MEEIENICVERLTQPTQEELNEQEQEILNCIDALETDDCITREAIFELAEAPDQTIEAITVMVNGQGYVQLGKILETYILKYRREVAEAKVRG